LADRDELGNVVALKLDAKEGERGRGKERARRKDKRQEGKQMKQKGKEGG
jgi:hypothetical protein